MSRLRVEVEHASARLERAGGNTLIDEAEIDGTIGSCKGCLDVTTLNGHTVDFVSSDLWVEEGSAGAQRFLCVDDGRQRLIVHLDEEAGISSSITALSQYDGNRIASIAGDVYC